MEYDNRVSNVRDVLWAHGMTIGEFAEKTQKNRNTVARRADQVLQLYHVDEKDLGQANICEKLYGRLRIADNLQYLIKKDGLLMAKIASDAGTTPRSMTRWISGEARPQPHYIRELCKLFNLTPLKLQYGIPEDDFKVKGAT